MWFSKNPFFTILIISFYSGLQANCSNLDVNVNCSLLCSLRVNESESCDNLNGYQIQANLLFNYVPHKLHEKLLFGSLADFTTEEIIKIPTNLLYFLPVNKLGVLSGFHLGSILIVHEDDIAIAKKILLSLLTNQQRTEFLNFLVPKVITNDKVLDLIGETVYKWNYDVKDGKFQRLSNINGYALARLWAPYVLTSTKPFSTRLLDFLADVVQKQNNRILYNKHTKVNWKNLPKHVRRLWSFLAVNQEYPNKLNNWTVEQIAQQYTFLLPELNNDELRLIPFDELSKMSLQDIDFDYTQARFLFSLLLENSTLKDVKLLYPTFFFKLSPLQINQFEPEEWTDEKSAILSLKNTYLSYTAAKQIFNKIASNRLSSRTTFINGWISEDLRHLPLLYTQPATSFLKFCTTPPSIQSLIAVDSYMLTDRQAFYLSGCSSMLSLRNNDPKFLLGLKYMIKAVPVSSLLNIDFGNINYKVASHLVSLVNEHNLPMALHLLSIINPGKETYFIEEMLKNKHNILFEQLAPLDIPGPIFDVLKHLYSNYTDRIDKLPKHILNTILESDELLIKWNGNESAVTKGLYNGYTCNFIKKLNSVKFIVSISNYNTYLKQNGKVFPKNLQTCVAEAFINYLKLKSKLTADLSTLLYLEAWEIEAIQGFILITLPVDVILNSNLRDNILYSIGQLSFPELMVASRPEKLSLMVDQYVTHIIKNKSHLSYEHLYTLGNLTHFISATYLSLVDEQAFKFLVEAGLFDTRICVDSKSRDKWAELMIKAFGNFEHWSSDTLVTLSDLLIVLNQDQLNSIPKLSRLNSADVIHTRYTDEIEWIPNNIPFYKGCALFLGDQYVNFTNYLSTLVNFHLVSLQSQLQMISPINDNHQYEEIIKSSEAKPKILKPTVLIPVPEFDNFLNILTPKRFLNNFFAGKEKSDTIGTPSTKESNWDSTTSTMEDFNDSFVSSQRVLISTEPTSVLEIKNSTTTSFLSTLNSSKYNQNSKNLENEHYTENVFDDVTFIPLMASTAGSFEGITSSPLGFNNIKKVNDINNNVYNITSNDSFPLEINELPAVEPKTSHQNHNERKIRSLELFFISDMLISCDALKMLGPASITSMQFNSIIHSMSDEELENCIDLLGSFDISPELANYIWSKTRDKTALHTYGSVLSGLSVDDIKTVDLNINSPWSLELIHLLSEHVKDNSVRKEIIKLFMTKSKSNIPSHLWGSFGSLICQLQPRTLKIIMPDNELFWKTSSAFNTIKACDSPCVKNLASIAISVIGQSNLWKTAEVERMGIILSGINITQWQLLLNYNPEALEGLSSNTIKCLNEQQIKLLNDTHLNYLTPKSAYMLLKSHSKLLDVQKQEILLKLVNFEIKADWQPTPVISILKNIGIHHKNSRESNSKTDSIYAFESTHNIYSNEMQADSKATTIHLSFSVFSAIVLLCVLN